MIHEEAIYKIGVMGKTHGVKGEISFIFNDDIFDTANADYLILKTDGIFVPFFIEEYRFKNNETALIKFEDINTQEQAKALTSCDVYLPRELAENTSDTLSWAQIIGFKLVDSANNKCIGKLLEVDESTINTLFVVEKDNGDTFLIPASPHFITEINASKQTITLSLPQGILDLDA